MERIMVSAHESTNINESQMGYQQLNISPNERRENEDQCRKSNAKKGCISTCRAYLKCIVIDKSLWWFKCHWSGKIMGSLLQLMVIGDVVSDLYFLSSLIEYKEGWYIFFSLLILYLSLRFTLVFTATFEYDFFGVKDSDGILGYHIHFVWDKFREITKFQWEDEAVEHSLGTITLLFIPGDWQIVVYVLYIKKQFRLDSSDRDPLLTRFIIAPLAALASEVIIVPIYVLVFSPFILVGHVIKGIYGVWKTNSVSFYENSFQIQTTIFYSTIASLFETITESLPQFLLQSWIYFHRKDLIPASTYYISVGFSVVNILKAIIIFILTRKELLVTTIRLGGMIIFEDENDVTLSLILSERKVDFMKQIVKCCPNSIVRHLDVSESMLTDDGMKDIMQHLRQLKSLTVGGPQITDKGIAYVAKYCLQLEKLDLRNARVTDEGLKAIAENCLLLKSLSLFNTCVTDGGLKSIAENCLELESIDLEEIEITDATLSLLLSNCPKMRTLRLPNKPSSYYLSHKYGRIYPNIFIFDW